MPFAHNGGQRLAGAATALVLLGAGCGGGSGGPGLEEVVAAAERGCADLRAVLDHLPEDPAQNPRLAIDVVNEALDAHDDALLDLPRASGDTLDVVNELYVPNTIKGALVDIETAVDEGVDEHPVDPAGARAAVAEGLDELNASSAQHGIDECVPAEPLLAATDVLAGLVGGSGNFELTGDFEADLGTLCSDFETAKLARTLQLGLPGASASTAMSALGSAVTVLLAGLEAVDVPSEHEAAVADVVTKAQRVKASAEDASDAALATPTAYEEARLGFEVAADELTAAFEALGTACEGDPVAALEDA